MRLCCNNFATLSRGLLECGGEEDRGSARGVTEPRAEGGYQKNFIAIWIMRGVENVVICPKFPEVILIAGAFQFG